MKKTRLSAMGVMIAGVMMLATAKADASVLFSGTGAWGEYTGSISYSLFDATSAELEIMLTNTSNLGNGGYLTAFVFNNPYDYISGISLASTDADFSLLNDSNAVNASPYGQFDFGASTGGSFQGGGNPAKGIAIGDTETFTFSLTGTNLDLLDEQSFGDELSTGTGSGEGYRPFVARYRGFRNGQSDKVPVDVRRPGDETNAVPEPASMMLFGVGLAGAYLRKKLA